MKLLRVLVVAVAGLLLFSLGSVLAQPSLFNNPNGESPLGTRIVRTRVIKQNEDKTELLLSVDYTYDGSAGPTGVLIPVIKKKGQPGVSGWFGCDPGTVSNGRGTVTLKIRYFNDEEGVPPQFTSDRIDVLILNASRISVISGTTVLKTIVWGNGVSPQKTVVSPPPVDPKVEALAAEARAHDAARRAADAEAKARAEAEEQQKQFAEKKSSDEQKAREQAEALRVAQQKAEAEKQARIKAEEEVRRKEAERLAAAKASVVEVKPIDPLAVDSGVRTKIINLDVVNRSLDRSQMTIGVEFDYKDALQNPSIGVDVMQAAQPQTRSFFDAQAVDLSKSKRGFVLVPVHFHPPKPEEEVYDAFGTDQVLVYLQEGPQSRRNLYPAVLPLTWHSPLARKHEFHAPENSIEIAGIKQDNFFSGNVAVKYLVGVPTAKVRLLLFNSNDLNSTEWFATPELTLDKGPGVQLVKFVVRSDAVASSDILKTDMVQVDLLDKNDNVLASVSKAAPLTWAKPK